MTKRSTVNAMEEQIGTKIGVLDHGFVCLIDYMGCDEDIAKAARISYGADTNNCNVESLIHYLMANNHTSPFEMLEIKLMVKMPIFVARQWIRHRTANVNEQSARYTVLDQSYYIPDTLRTQHTINKQGSLPLDADASAALHDMDQHSIESYNLYKSLIESDNHVAREMARIVLPLNYYTTMVWKIDLHNLFNFLSLRNDSHAQHEIQEYAKVIERIVQQWVPIAYGAYIAHRRNTSKIPNEVLATISSSLSEEQKSELKQHILSSIHSKSERIRLTNILC